MLTLVIPKIGAIIVASGGPIPVYTQFVLWHERFLHPLRMVPSHRGIIIGGFFLVRFFRTEAGKRSLDQFKITVPFGKNLYQKLYLSRSPTT